MVLEVRLGLVVTLSMRGFGSVYLGVKLGHIKYNDPFSKGSTFH